MIQIQPKKNKIEKKKESVILLLYFKPISILYYIDMRGHSWILIK